MQEFTGCLTFVVTMQTHHTLQSHFEYLSGAQVTPGLECNATQ